MMPVTTRVVFLCAAIRFLHAIASAQEAGNPYERQVGEQIKKLASASAESRSGAAEALGFLRACEAEQPLIGRLRDESSEVRRQAAMALAWCGGRKAVPPLLKTLEDEEWMVRQAAWIALTNLTGMEFPFDCLDQAGERAAQAARWYRWWANVPIDRPPQEVLDLLAGPSNLASGRPIETSTTYLGPPEIMTDGQFGPRYWQTKNVRPPQWCTIDLGRVAEIDQVVVHQYGPGYCMSEYELAVSLDNRQFEAAVREKRPTETTLVLDFPPRPARYVRITSLANQSPRYPTTFFEIEVHSAKSPKVQFNEPVAWRQERGLRALGVLGTRGASEAILAVLGNAPPTATPFRPTVRAGLRSLGRLREEVGFQALLRLLDHPFWARYAADALGDFGDPRAVPGLIAAYARFAKRLDGSDPPEVPADDKMSFPSLDRMLETPYLVAYALCRLPLDDPKDLEALRRIAPLVMANLPGDHDTYVLYEPEVGHLLTRWLMDHSGLRQQACEHAFERLGRPRRVAKPAGGPAWSEFPPDRIASWLPAVCTEREDLPRLLALLEHDDGWVRLNAAKAIAWLGDRRAVGPIARLLAESKSEADYGYSGTFKDEEYNDSAPRWREGPIRALGLLGAHEHTDLLVRILNDERSVVDVRHAAAEALADLGNDAALEALATAALSHSFHSIRHIARDALWTRGIDPARNLREPEETPRLLPDPCPDAPQPLEAIVFVKGDNNLPNTLGTVEQADRWRQTYAVTDSGPVYRAGANLFLLRPPKPDGEAIPLTRFPDGYVGEPELSWDARQVVFTRRGQLDPWWHIWRIGVDGSGLEQLTDGPYHSVGPAWLPDGRIVFASSRAGIRDEYHGYPCTALCVMNPDGTDLHPVATNIGRDNEPAVLADGRIAFSRLEVFYSRNKTELTLHAMHPDGTMDLVLYGPERRRYWRALDHGPPSPADEQEAPLTHRVLRITQPQAMPDGQKILAVTQGGLTLIGPLRDRETLLALDDEKHRAYTTPFPLPDGRLLCAVTAKIPEREKIDLGLYVFDPSDQSLELIYNDPKAADYEPRPVLARRPPLVQPVQAKRYAYSGRFLCSSVFATQEQDVPVRGRFVRLIEGVPVVSRHSTHTNPEPVWKNHGGTFARVLGMAPLAPDGSFCVEVPADRLLHFQVLDSDRRVIGNQLTWIYPRPGETKSCVGCHENPHTTTRRADALAAHYPPLDFRPRGDEFTYRAKAWFKGHLPPEIEERTRTVRAVNLLGR
ncbi:MAG: HEAT repeat domain-containing protein [Pirellulales bacterium]|nr:HEAT repeat domain-containing protein [Pirellulales bacterium]